MFFHKCHDVLLLSNISWGKIYAPAAASSSRLHLFKYQCNNRTNNRKINPPTPRTDCTASGSQTLHNASPHQSAFFFFFLQKGQFSNLQDGYKNVDIPDTSHLRIHLQCLQHEALYTWFHLQCTADTHLSFCSGLSCITPTMKESCPRVGLCLRTA